jgi:hypothetical protein
VPLSHDRGPVVGLDDGPGVRPRGPVAPLTSGRRDDLREVALSIAAGEGGGVEDVVLVNDRLVGVVAQEVMTWLGWL